MLIQMIRESPLWPDSQIQELQPSLERTRQMIIQIFPDWLGRQAPRDGTPDAAGDFKHKMLRLTGGNLKKLGLNDLYEQLEKRTLDVIKNIETAAEARQLFREVELWLTTHGDATRFVRVAELRALHQVGKDYAHKLQGLATRIQMPEIMEVRRSLSNSLSKMKEAEADLVRRASKLWKSKLRSLDDIDSLSAEVDALAGAFEGCQTDLEDLQLMRRALRLYQKDYRQLDDDRLTWTEFQSLVESLKREAVGALEGEELPWPPEETIIDFVTVISKERKAASAGWIKTLETCTEDISTMSAADANQLHVRANSPPAILTDEHAQRTSAVLKTIETRLDALKLDWLVERFSELPPQSQKQFLEVARGILSGSA